MKLNIIIATACLLLGAILGVKFFPDIKEKQVEVEKIVKDIVTVTKIVTKPDGTKEQTTTTTDKTKENKSSTLITLKPNWHAGIGTHTDASGTLSYSVSAERRILSNLFLGISLNTNKTAGATISVEF